LIEVTAGEGAGVGCGDGRQVERGDCQELDLPICLHSEFSIALHEGYWFERSGADFLQRTVKEKSGGSGKKRGEIPRLRKPTPSWERRRKKSIGLLRSE
jgi:hypothetical protein